MPLASKIIIEEIDNVRTQTVGEEELDTSRKAFLERFPRTFESKPAMLAVFVNDEMTRRPKDYWQTVRDKVKAVVGMDPVETVAGVAQRNYQRWRSVQDEIFKTLMNATGRGGRDGEEKPADVTSHQ